MRLDTLIQQCRQGDELAWEALVRRYQGRVFGLTYHYLHDREEARDVAQEAFLRVYRNLHRFNEAAGSFPAWLVRVTRNCCIDRLRKLRSTPAYRGEPLAADTASGNNPGGDTRPARPAVPAATSPSPSEHARAGERRELLMRAMDRMSALNREMILLKDIQGLKQREIAEMLSIPLGTVKARSNRARLELADRLLELDPTFGT